MNKIYTLLLLLPLAFSFSCKEEYSNQYNSQYNYSGPPPDNKIYFMELVDSEITTNLIMHYTLTEINNNPNMLQNNTYLVFGTKKGTLYNFDYRKGVFRWEKKFKSEIKSTPSAYKNTLFFSTKEGNINAIDINTGNTIWEYKIGSEILKDSLVTEKAVYFSSKNNKIYSFNIENGNLNWVYTSNLSIETNILSYKDKLYFGTSNGIDCISEDEGKSLWRFTSNAKTLSMPIATNNQIFFVSNDNNIYSINSENSNFIWSTKLEKPSNSIPSINKNKGRIYVYSNKKLLYIDIKNGDIVRETKLNEIINTPIININGFIYITDNNSRLYCIDETNQEIKWYFDGFGKNPTSPLLYNGIIHFANNEGIIYAIGRNEDYQIYNPLIKKVNDTIKNRKGINQHRAAYNYGSGKIPNGVLKYKVELKDNITNSISDENDDFYISAGNKLYTIKEDSDFIRWDYDTSSKITSSIFASNRILSFADLEGTIYSMHADYRQVNWRYNTGASINSSPFVSQDKVFIGNDKGEFMAFDSIGNLLWKYKTNGKINFDPIAYKNFVYFASNDSYLYCLDTNKGNLIWKYKIIKSSKSTIIHDDKLYIASGKELLCIDYLSGKLIWKYETKMPINSIPAIYNNNIYFVNQEKILYALNISDGKKIWNYNIQNNVEGGLSIVDDYIYFGDIKGIVYSIDYREGKKKWELDLKEKISTSPIISKGLLYICAGKTFFVIK